MERRDSEEERKMWYKITLWGQGFGGGNTVHRFSSFLFINFFQQNLMSTIYAVLVCISDTEDKE